MPRVVRTAGLTVLLVVAVAATAGAAVKLKESSVLRAAPEPSADVSAEAPLRNRSGRRLRYEVQGQAPDWLLLRLGTREGWIEAAATEPTDLPADPRVRCGNGESSSPGEGPDGRLRGGFLFPVEGESFFTWSFRDQSKPNPARTRWGTCKLVKLVLRVAREFHREHPTAPRLAVGDLSLRRGGPIGGHVSHQRGLDVDIYYPRRDGREVEPRRASQIDRDLSQELVARFVKRRVDKIFVGYNTGLRGPRSVVQALPKHDDHLHVRIR